MTRISRRKFRKAIEHGICQSPTLTDAEVVALRAVGLTATEFNGSFVEPPYCPGKQAALPVADRRLKFGVGFDFWLIYRGDPQHKAGGYAAPVKVGRWWSR